MVGILAVLQAEEIGTEFAGINRVDSDIDHRAGRRHVTGTRYAARVDA